MSIMSFHTLLSFLFFISLHSHSILGINTSNPCIPYPFPPVPALFSFGDSYIDCGNNKFLNTTAQANTSPYGIDHPLGTTGRFTNGLTIVDFFAQWLGLNFQAPALDPTLNESQILMGLNFGSGSTGFLEETGPINVKHFYMKAQVDKFNKTVMVKLPQCFDSAKVKEYLSNSLFYVNTGHNDYALSYLKTDLNNKYNAEDFTNLLLTELENNLKVLYNLGARKIITAEIAPIGCMPAAFKDPHNPPIKCNESLNSLVEIYNSKLADTLAHLGSILKDSIFIVGKQYEVILDMVENPTKYGLVDGRNPCIDVKKNPCENRNSKVYFDAIHPTEIVYKTYAAGCFNGSGICVPINIDQLAKKKL